MVCNARAFASAALRTTALQVGCIATVGVAGAAGQTRLLVSSVLYESSTVVAPVVVYVDSDPRREWRAGLAGWTLSAETTRALKERTAWLAGAELTPLNAHSSNRIYAAGTAVDSLAFENAAARVWLGVRRDHSPDWSRTLRASVLYERVGPSANEVTEAFWELPFVGIEWSERWRRTSSEDPIRHSWSGATATLQASAYGGARSWARASAALAAATAGPLRVRTTVTAFAGSNLNLVSSFLVGGSWDLPGMLPLYGYPYAAFRLEQGLLFDAGADLLVARRFDVGLRGGLLAASGRARGGAALRLATVMSGVGMSVQLAVPDDAVGSDRRWPVMLVADATAAFFTR